MAVFEVKHLTIKQGDNTLWHNLSFQLQRGDRLGISAPSGYGKTTLGRVLAKWQVPAQGDLLFQGEPLAEKGYCPVQLVPQHPDKCFNPYRTTGESVRDAWQPTEEWLDKLHIQPQWLERRPHELSGGELARIALLRALDPRTAVLIADEATAQLDPRIQAQIWRVLLDECQRRPMAMIIFSHNKALLDKVSSHVITW